MSRSLNDLPSQGSPNMVAEKRDGSGNLIQQRYYGPDGRAKMNIDYGHDHNGVGDPHAHDWDWAKLKNKRQPPRALNPGE